MKKVFIAALILSAMKKIITVITLCVCLQQLRAQTINVQVQQGGLIMADYKRLAGDTLQLQMKGMYAGDNFTLVFNNPDLDESIQGFLYDTYLHIHMPVNCRQAYYEFTTTAETASFSASRFYMVLKKCW